MTRRVRIALGAFAVLATAGFAVWQVWIPRERPDLKSGESYGIDVSNHQGDIDWTRVAGDDIDFAYLKATEGGDFVDQTFQENWEQSRDVGLEVGAYHFFTLCRGGGEQAANFLSTLESIDADSPDGGDLPPALDLEFGGNCSERPSKQWVQEQVGIWLDAVEEATGSEALLYVMSDFDDRYAILEQFPQPTWRRNILRRPSDDDRWQFWQVSFTARVAGVDGGVDLNVRRPSDG